MAAGFDARLQTRLATALRAAVMHCVSAQRDNGSWHVEPDPRITETALGAIALMQSRRGECQAAVQRARAWLRVAHPQRHDPAAELIEETLRSQALGEDTRLELGHPVLAAPVLSGRLRLLQVIALRLGRRATGDADPRTLRRELTAACNRTGPLKRWSRVELWSAHALVEAHFGDRDRALHAVTRIAEEQADDGGFFANPVSSAMACLALQTVAPESTEASRCRNYLLRSQLPDGTWRFCSSDSWDTTLTIRAFHGEPAFDNQALPRAVEFLLAAQNEDGGWPFRSGVESDNDTTGAALIALACSQAPNETIHRGLQHVAGQQLPDGLWRTWQSAGDPPAEDVVAHVVTALGCYPQDHAIAVERAREWLVERYKQRGRWSASWYHGHPYAVAEVLPALAPGDPARQASVKELLRAQNPDGGWSPEPGEASCPSSTGQALAAMAQAGVHDENCWEAGTRYLLGTQREDGSWVGEPLMYGPRPLLTHYQTHTQAFAVMGLRAAQQWPRSTSIGG